jgi:hypothetical protein
MSTGQAVTANRVLSDGTFRKLSPHVSDFVRI